MRTNKGISLIVLVITIVVMLILAGVVVLSLANNNPITQSKEAQFKSNIDAYNSELSMVVSNKYLKNRAFDKDTFNFPLWDGISGGEGTIKEHIQSLTKEDGPKFKIEKGKLVYVGSSEVEQNWFTDMNINN